VVQLSYRTMILVGTHAKRPECRTAGKIRMLRMRGNRHCSVQVVSNGYADDSVASCKNCGHVFGRWADVKAKAIEVMKAELGLPDALKNIFKGR
jgi:hypothetical protein